MNQFIPTSFNFVLESRGHSPQHLLTPVIQELQNVYQNVERRENYDNVTQFFLNISDIDDKTEVKRLPLLIGHAI